MDLEAWLITLRTASVIVIGVLGIVGTLGKFRRKNGNLNTWGYAAIGFILISTVISLSLTLIEAKKEKTEAVEQLSRMEGLLKEISRVRQPITQLEVHFEVELPNTTRVVQEYIAQLDKVIDSRKVELQNYFSKIEGLEARDPGGELLTDVRVSQKSPYWPKDHEKIIGSIAANFRFTIFIRKEPIKSDLFHVGFSDWSAVSLPTPLQILQQGENKISMNFQDKKLYVTGSTEYEKTMWHTTGKITSIQDLYGSQLFLLPPDSLDFELPQKFKAQLPQEFKSQFLEAHKEDPLKKAISRSITIKSVGLQFSIGNKIIMIDGSKFNKSKYKHGYPVFSIILPNNEKELLDLAPKE